jgi:hypothetical protein
MGVAEVEGEEIHSTVMGIGEIVGWGGFISGISLATGGISVLAILAALCAVLARRAPDKFVVGWWTLAAGLTLAAVNQWPGLGTEWLTTVAIVLMVLGLAAVAASSLKPVAQSA